MHAHDHHDQRKFGTDIGRLTVAVNDGHQGHTHGAVVHDLGQQGGGQTQEQGKGQRGAAGDDGIKRHHQEGSDAAFRLGHGTGQGLHEGQQHDAPGDAGVHHDLEVQQGLAFHLDGRHDRHQQDDDTGIADALEEAGQEEVLGHEVGGQQQDDQQEQEGQDDLLHAGKDQAAVLVQLAHIQMDEFAHVGTEDVLAHDDEEQRAHGADEQGDEHVLGIVDAHTGHGLIGAEHGQGGLLEGDEGHAHLGGEHDTEHHHGGVNRHPS